MPGYPSLIEIVTTIAEIAFGFLFGVAVLAGAIMGFNWVREKFNL